jgi:hypothetical protein
MGKHLHKGYLENRDTSMGTSRNIEMRRIEQEICIAITILLLIFSFTYIYINNFESQAQQYYVENGYLDLNNWEDLGKKNIDLTGEWEFYPGELIEPSQNHTIHENTSLNSARKNKSI